MKFSKSLAAIVCMLALLPAWGFAQTDQGRPSAEPSGTSPTRSYRARRSRSRTRKTGEERTTTTNDQGYFVMAFLKPSTYTIKAEKTGFGALDYPSMTVAVGQELTLDFELKPAGVQEAVTVVGTAPVLDMSSARIGVNRESSAKWTTFQSTAGRCRS